MIEYIATFDEDSAKEAAKAFFIRSLRELRLWRTVLPPFAFACAAALIYAMPGVPTWIHVEAWGFFALSLLYTPFFYMLLPWAEARRARMMPTRRIRITSEAIEIESAGGRTRIPWHRFRRLWNIGDHMFLVINPFVCIKLPTKDMPDEARRVIAQSISER